MAKDFSIQKLLDEIKLSPGDLPGDLAGLAKLLERKVPGRGVELALLLGEKYRGTTMYFHNVDQLFRRLRNDWLIDQYGSGVKVAELARTVRLSERQVWEILGKEPGEERQMKLF